MTNLKLKITTAVVAGSFLAGIVMPAGAFAATKVVIKKNGANSNNTANVTVKNKNKLTQSNSTAVVNLVGVFQNTGGNKANNNTGDGDVNVDSGAATSTVTNTTTTGGNSATGNLCGCPDGDTVVKIKGNGANSDNTANVTSVNKSSVTQSNQTLVVNGVLVAQNTGGNSANGNTGDGNVDVNSGNVTSTVSNTTTTNGNVINP